MFPTPKLALWLSCFSCFLELIPMILLCFLSYILPVIYFLAGQCGSDMYQSHNAIVKAEQTGEEQLSNLSLTVRKRGSCPFQERDIKMALHKMESVSCRIKEVTQISVNVYFFKFWVVPPYLSLHVATFPRRLLQYQQSMLMFRVGIFCSAQRVQLCRGLHSMRHWVDFKTTIFTVFSVKKKKRERKNISLWSAVNVWNMRKFPNKTTLREKKPLHFNFFPCFSETEIQVVFWFDQIGIFPVAVFFSSVFIARSPFSQDFLSLWNELQSSVQSSSLGMIIFLVPLPEHLCPYLDTLYCTSPSLFVCGFVPEWRFNISWENEYRFAACHVPNKYCQPVYSANQRRPTSPARDTIHLLLATGKHCSLECTPCLCPRSADDVCAAALMLAI